MMKKLFGLCSFIIFLLVVNCDNEPYEGDIIIEDNNCTRAILATNEAAQDYLLATVEDSMLLCQVFRDALEYQIEICGDASGELQEIIDFLGNCMTIFNDPCTIARNETEIAFQDFLNAPILEYEATCLAYVEAIENEILICGDDGSLRALINELGDCEPVFVETTGTWRLVSWLNNLPLDIDNDGVATVDYLEEIDCYNNETISFYSDGTGAFFFRSIANITYTSVMNSSTDVDFMITCNEINEDKSFTYFQDGNTVMIILSDGTVINHFRNADSLFVVVESGFYATNSEDSTETIVEPVTYVYVKL